jgi:hypothetical protein
LSEAELGELRRLLGVVRTNLDESLAAREAG